MVALATAFVRVRPDPATRATFQTETDAAIAPAAAASGDKAAATFGSRMSAGLAKLTPQIAKWGSVAFAGAVAGALVAGSKLEDSQAALGRAIADTGGKVTQFAGPIATAQKSMEKFGATSTTTNQALTVLITATGSTKLALGLLSTAADLAAFKHISLAAAATLLAKASGGAAKGLKDLGVTQATGTTQAEAMTKANELLADQVSTAGGIAAFAASRHLSLAAATKLVGDAAAGSIPAMNKLGIDVLPTSATAAQRLGELTSIMNAKIGGQASAAADTSAGKFKAMTAQVTDLGAKIGAKLMPLLSTLLGFLSGPAGIPVLIGLVTLAFIAWTASMVTSVAALLGFSSAGAAAAAAIALVQGAAIGTRLGLLALQVQAIAMAAWAGIVSVATKVWAAGQWLLNAALSANPIGITIVAVAALVAVIILAYTHSATFRQIVSDAFHAVLTAAQDTWHWITANWPLLLGILTGPIGLAVVEIIKHWGEITAGAKAIVTDITGWFSAAGTWLYNAGKDVISGLFNGALDEIKGVGAWVKSIGDLIVQGVKDFFGIKSPSTVFAGIGGHLMAGLLQGMIGGSAGLVSKVFGSMPAALEHFAEQGLVSLANLPGKAVSLLASLGGQLGSFFSGLFGGGAASGVKQWTADVLAALSMLNLPASYLPLVLNQMQSESGGNPNAQNNTDINAKMGVPSQGLMQVIRPTFERWRDPALPDNPFNPLANIYAALNYAKHGKGFGTGPGQIGSMHGYAVGGLITEPIFGVGRSGKHYAFGENGPETVTPGAGAGGGHRTYNVNVNVPPNANKADTGRAVVDAIIAYETGSGSAWRAGAR